MRLLSALVVLTAAASAAGCSIPVAPSPKPEPAIASLKDLGVEGRTYVADLGADRAFRLLRVHAAGNDLLLEDIAGSLVYVDGATLNPRWAYFGLPRPFDQTPDVSDSLIAGVCQEKLYVLSRDNGLELFAPSPVPVVPSAAIVANESTVYIPTYRTPSGNKTVISVNLADGYVGWGFRTQADITTDLKKAGSLGGDMFYAATETGLIYGIPTYPATARTTDPAWVMDLRSGVHRNMAVDGDLLGVVTDDATLVCLDRITGATRLEEYSKSGESAGSGAQFSSTMVFYACGGELRAFDRMTGAPAWAVKGPTRFIADRGARTIVGDDQGHLWAVDAKSGKVLGAKSMPGWTIPTRKAPDATLIAISRNGMIVGIETGW